VAVAPSIDQGMAVGGLRGVDVAVQVVSVAGGLGVGVGLFETATEVVD